VVIIVGVLVPFWAMTFLANRASPAAIMRLWWVPAVVMLVCIALYAFSFYKIENALNARRESLINLIAGASDK
jgi:hypothetical protein